MHSFDQKISPRRSACIFQSLELSVEITKRSGSQSFDRLRLRLAPKRLCIGQAGPPRGRQDNGAPAPVVSRLTVDEAVARQRFQVSRQGGSIHPQPGCQRAKCARTPTRERPARKYRQNRKLVGCQAHGRQGGIIVPGHRPHSTPQIETDARGGRERIFYAKGRFHNLSVYALILFVKAARVGRPRPFTEVHWNESLG
jgi:hypothetical protein